MSYNPNHTPQIGDTLIDMHGLSFHQPPEVKRIKFLSWIALKTTKDMMPKDIDYMGLGFGVYQNKTLVVIDYGIVACRYDSHWFMLGTFEWE